MNRILAVGALLLLMGAADISSLDRVMGALAERKHGHVSFTEKKFIAVLDEPVESSGELLYDAPDRLEKKTLRPKPEDLVLEGGIVSAQRGKRHYTLDLKPPWRVTAPRWRRFSRLILAAISSTGHWSWCRWMPGWPGRSRGFT
jgi:hypothetical protein